MSETKDIVLNDVVDNSLVGAISLNTPKKEEPVQEETKKRRLASLFAKKDKKKSEGSQMLEWKKDWWKAIICLTPCLIILGIFTFYPIINTFIVSFFPDYNYYTGAFGQFGFESFRLVLTDKVFWNAMLNTVIMVVVSVPLSIIISLLITVLLNSIKKLQGLYQTIFFLPYVTNGMAFGLVFTTIFSADQFGLVNSILYDWFGISIRWTGNNNVDFWTGIFVITIYAIWSGLAFKILVFLGGLQGIDKQYYQAAQIDSTPKTRVFTKITVPLLSPMIMYITITSLMGAFKSYSDVVALYGEDMCGGKFMTAVGYIYEYFNSVTQDGPQGALMLSQAAAAALILFVFILIITFVQMWVNNKKVHY